MSFRPVDQDARERARRDFATSLVVEAGAGTGKTTLLVDRMEALICSGTARLPEIAAVTFTENAATTMKLRLRERLEKARAGGAPGPEAARAAEALDVLERAPISTIHALCAAILQERPLDCGVLPGFRVADESEMDLLFAEAWESWLAERLVAGDETLVDALERGIPLEGVGPYDERSSLRGLARTLLDQRDLTPLAAEGAVDPGTWRKELLARAARARELTAGVAPGDLLAARLLELVAFAEQSRFCEGSVLLVHLASIREIPRHFGHKPRWPSREALEEGRQIAEWTRAGPAAWSAARGASLHGRLVRALRGVLDLYDKRKRERGLIDFLDLLLLARRALRDSDSVRRYFRERFRFLIIDEFQDTDRLQVEIAQLLAGVAPGGLVVVGDAKQSIYRFRRAEVSLFRRLSQEAAAGQGRAVLHLTQSFRARPALLRFVNRVFSELIQPSLEADQPAYEPIAPPPGLPDDPAVLALGFSAPFASGEDLLRAEAGALAALVSQVARGGYPVREVGSGDERRSRAGDVMVLARRLTQVRHLEEALEAAGLRFTVEGGKSFFDRQEVHEALAVLRAVDDPSDRVSLVAALRSSFFGVDDRTIVSYALAGGGLWLGKVDESKPGAESLGPALQLLDELHRQRTYTSVPALLERLFQGTRILAALTGTRRGEAQVANLEKVVALARQATDLGVLTLRGFTRLLAERIQSAREEPDLPTTRPGDPATVRILSIHRAKGLEAPVVALYDTADNASAPVDTVPLWEEGRIAIGFRLGCQPPGWDALVRKEEAKARAETRRLLYVACTRARDWLIIPRAPGNARVGDFWRELSTRLPSTSDADVQVLDADTLPRPDSPGGRAELFAITRSEGGDAVAARWEAERSALLEAGAKRPLVPVPVTRKARREGPPPSPAAGPGGPDFGRLVHRILEWVPFHEAENGRVQALAEALAPALGLDAAAGQRAGEQVERALALPVMQRASRATRIWRELPLLFPDPPDLVEGVVDLVFEEEGQLVVVDYKSDAIEPAQAFAQAAFHAPQLQLYGRGLAQALGRPVKERLVLFTALGQVVPV